MRLGVRLGSPFLRPVVAPPVRFPNMKSLLPIHLVDLNALAPSRFMTDRLAVIDAKIYAFKDVVTSSSR